MISTPNDRKILKDAIREVSDSLTRTQSESEHRSSIYENLKDKVDISKSNFNKLCKRYFKQDLSEVQSETQELVDLYTEIFE